MIICKQGKAHMLLVFTCFLCVWWNTCIQVKAANHSLKQGEILNATGTLYSEKGQYFLAFAQMSLGQNTTYLTIYGTNEEDNWGVWVANRNQPLDPNTAVLMLDHSGVLKIEYKYGEPITLYSPPQPTNNTVATSLDTGNFVLQQLHPNGSTKSLLWQSFDTPDDSLLPGMKLGVDHKTGHNWSLVSWLTSINPAPGPFKLEWDPKRRELMIRRRGQVCWTSGELRDKRFKHISGEARFKIVSNENEDYFTLEASTERLAKWTLLDTGQLINKDQGIDIARADRCYGYNTDGGCQRWEDIPSCRDPGDAFVEKEGYPNYNQMTVETNSSYGPSDCQAMCWSNCSCVGFKQAKDDDETGCSFLWNSTEGTNFANGGVKLYILVKNNHHRRIKMWVWISAAIAIVLLVIGMSILCLVLKKRRYILFKEKKREGKETEMLDLEDSEIFYGNKNLEQDLKTGHNLIVFNYASISEATNGFSNVNKLGQGGFGPVYKGIFSTGQEVAVKRLSKTSGQGIIEFKNELSLICELQHTNLVKLLGFCIHQQERMLIYEYMPNKSLDFYLFDSSRSKLLDWKKRFNIIEGICQGLLYLHKYSRLKVIHRDLKAGNILLDENMNPKISDFGMARMFAQQESAANTNRIVGTYGYMSPEYVMEGVFSTKSDVYSFGILLLEIVCGRRNNSFCDAEHPINLVGHVWEAWNEGVSLKLMDPSLNDSFDHEEVQRCIHVGLLCVEHYAKDRPKMSDIISVLTNKSPIVTLPQRPAFYYGRDICEGNVSSTASFTYSTDITFASSEIESKANSLVKFYS